MTDPGKSKNQVIAIIGLGSNLPDRLQHLQHAVDLWRIAENVRLLAISGVYESPPEGPDVTGDFLNACIAAETSLSPEDLINLCHEIENACGRNRDEEEKSGIRNRTMDCDVIFHGDIELEKPGLEIPHRLWHSRDFVLMPILDLRDALTERQRLLVDEFTSGMNFDSASCHRIETVLH
jgi:2-amino-4-hydroxy-6-hydroxymethyldihydropteridine diphosphokinase